MLEQVTSKTYMKVVASKNHNELGPSGMIASYNSSLQSLIHWDLRTIWILGANFKTAILSNLC